MAVQNPTTNFNWTLPIVGASVSVWGNMLNEILGDDATGIDARIAARLPLEGGTLSGPLTVNSNLNVGGGGVIQVGGTTVISASRFLSNVTANADIITAGTFGADRIPNLPASKITSGTLADARLSSNIPRLNAADNVFSERVSAASFQTNLGNRTTTLLQGDTNARLRLSASGVGEVPFEIQGNSDTLRLRVGTTGVYIPGALQIGDGTTVISASRILSNVTADAGIIVAGTFADARIPNLNASKITAGTFAEARIPVLSVAKIPDLPASKITSGTMSGDRISGGTPTVSGLANGASPIAVSASSFQVPVRTSDPSDTGLGSLYFNSMTGFLRVRITSGWVSVTVS